ncbi:hypothetical protein [Stenotrophomonas maltophilia]|uniref:hypothetical protein n=1 Tax=Stenotrophomonas maltophilia TaxID=40324 RepID=UPI000A4DEA16|nr:hypothetical protein [Stenotrophomonas maltophilia]
MPFPLPDSITNSFNAEHDLCPSEDNEPSVPKASGVDGGADARIDRLVGIIEQQGKQIAELTVHVGLLVQAVAQLLGEEAGAPIQDEGGEPERVDLDGRPY